MVIPLPDPEAARRWADDLDLVQRVLAGDAQARRQFAERMGCVAPYLAEIHRRRGSALSREDLADLVQDVIVLIWRKLGTFEGRSTLESWTWRFCQLELANRARQVRREGGLAARVGAAQEVDGRAPELLPHLRYEHLDQGLAALGTPEEEIIRLKHFEHLMFSEIAARLGLPTNTAKTRYYRGIQWLRQYLERRGEVGP